MVIQYYVKGVALALMIVIAALAARPAAADPSTEIVVFGDSLSDVGQFYETTLGYTGFAYPPAPFYYDGRFSDGPLWWEHMASALGVPAESHAVGGAFTNDENENDGVFTGNPVVEEYDGLADQIAAYIAAHPEGINPNALYIVWAGANDVIRDFGIFAVTGNPASFDVAGTTSNLLGAIDALGQAGGRYFLVPNMPNLGVLPRVLEFGPAVSGLLSAISHQYVQAFAFALDQYLITVPYNVVVVDSFALLTVINQNPASFGLNEVEQPCLVRSNPTNPATWTYCGLPAPDGWFFWDDIHPTAQGHAIIGNEFRSEFCGTDNDSPGLRGNPQRQAPPVWRGICYGSP